MKLVVSSSGLLKGMTTVSKALPIKTDEAILENFLFDLKGDSLKITASDEKITLTTEVPVQNTIEEGKIAVPARYLINLIKEFSDQPLTISTTLENSFEIVSEGGNYNFPYNNPDDYPNIATPGETAISVEIPSESLAEGINSTVYAASDEDNRPIMNSIFFDITPDATTLVASDLQKLVCYMVDDLKSEQEASFILNSRHALALRSILGKDETVTIRFDGNVAVFSFGSTTAICNLVVGKYPAYKSIIPQNNSNILTISRVQFLSTVRRIANCSPKSSNHIRFDLRPGEFGISAQDTGFEIAGKEVLTCSYEGDELSIGFKSTHLIEMLSNLSCETVVMKFADRRRAALMLPSEDEAASEKVFGIVMPVMVR